MNFDQTLALFDGVTEACSAIVVLVLAILAYRRTRDWGFSCWIFSSSGVLLETVSLHGVPIFRYPAGYRTIFLATVLAFTIGAVRIVYRYLQLVAAVDSSER